MGLFLTALYTMSTPLFFLLRAKRAKLAGAPASRTSSRETDHTHLLSNFTDLFLLSSSLKPGKQVNIPSNCKSEKARRVSEEVLNCVNSTRKLHLFKIVPPFHNVSKLFQILVLGSFPTANEPCTRQPRTTFQAFYNAAL